MRLVATLATLQAGKMSASKLIHYFPVIQLNTHFNTRTEHQHVGRKSSGGTSSSSTDCRKKGSQRDGILGVLQSTMSSPSSFSVGGLVHFPNF